MKISKAERVRQLKLAAELEDVQNQLVTAENHFAATATMLASITATVNQIICRIIEDGGTRV